MLIVWILVAFLLGSFFSGAVSSVAAIPGLRDGLVGGTIFLMGLTLPASVMGRSLGRGASWIAIGINGMGVPLLMAIVFRVLPAGWLSVGMRTGLWAAAIVPCTLASAAVWTRRGGGDDSIAMATTVVTNLACLVSVPILSRWWLEPSTDQIIDAGSTAIKLAWTVVLPLAAAALIRWQGAAAWADRHKPVLGSIAQAGILAMVAFGAAAVQSVANDDQYSTGQMGQIAIVICIVSAVHTVALWFGVATSRMAGYDRPDQIAVGISGSQKTLMVGLQISIDAGGSVVPMLAFHVLQLLIDTAVTDRWRRGS